MEPRPSSFDLSIARAAAFEAARCWGVEVGTPFAFSNVSFVAPAGDDAVVKVAWEGDDEALHEGDALELWDGEASVRLLRRHGRALLVQRAVPGDDISELDDEQATAVATAVATQIWRPATRPFRPVEPEVRRWLDRAEAEGSPNASTTCRRSCGSRGTTASKTERAPSAESRRSSRWASTSSASAPGP